jgi:hypothetical protein
MNFKPIEDILYIIFNLNKCSDYDDLPSIADDIKLEYYLLISYLWEAKRYISKVFPKIQIERKNEARLRLYKYDAGWK